MWLDSGNFQRFNHLAPIDELVTFSLIATNFCTMTRLNLLIFSNSAWLCELLTCTIRNIHWKIAYHNQKIQRKNFIPTLDSMRKKNLGTVPGSLLMFLCSLLLLMVHCPFDPIKSVYILGNYDTSLPIAVSFPNDNLKCL